MVLPVTALLESPAIRQQVHLMSIDEYHRAGLTGVFSDDVELLRGIVVTKMPKSPLHELVADQLMDILLAQLPNDFKVRRAGPLTLRDSEPEPDISVIQGKRDDWAKAHPSTAQLVIEVAVTSKAVDHSKAEIYAEAGISEYWLVIPEERIVEVYCEPARDHYLSKRTLGEHDILRSAGIAGLEFSIAEILP